MGTTCTAAAVVGDRLYYGHVGDSRLYLIRNGEISRLTRDQSLVQRLVDGGFITEEEAEDHPDRNVLVSALGMSGAVSVDVPRKASPRDRRHPAGVHGRPAWSRLGRRLRDAVIRCDPRQACWSWYR